MDTSLFPSIEEILSAPRILPSYFKKRYPEFFEYINTIPGDRFIEKIYQYIHGGQIEHKCEVCGRPTKFLDMTRGYAKCCSTQCSHNNPLIRDRVKSTLLNRYGSISYNNRNKAQQTCLERYGVANPYQSEEVKQKLKNIYNSRYGVDYPSQSKSVQETRRQNSLIKYGVDHHGKTPEVRKKLSKSNHIHVIENDENIIGYDNDIQIRRCPHPGCDECKEKCYKISSSQYNARKEFGIEPCTKLHPIQVGKNQKSLLEKFIRKILTEHNIHILPAESRSILPSHKGLDIVAPDHKIAIECNGCYWHSDQLKPYKYHLEKFREALSVGYELITIWDDQFITRPEIVKSIVLSKFNIYKQKFGARLCTVREISGSVSNNFLAKNHIQGETRAKIHLGLYREDELVGVMSFTRRSKLSGGKNDDCWELIRFCTKLYTQIHGGASKLLKYFVDKYSPTKIISFSSNDISTGKLYRKLGFICDNEYTLAYWYVHKKTNIRYHRSGFSKSRLKRMGYDTENQTESEIMKTLPYHKIWDSGHLKHTLNLHILNHGTK